MARTGSADPTSYRRGYHLRVDPVSRSEELFERARAVIPGGVDSPVRAFGAVGGTPVFIERGEGAYVIDVDGNRYVDLVQSWGALLFGHARAEIVDAAASSVARARRSARRRPARSSSPSASSKRCRASSASRLVNSGTEAAMSAIRLARGATGRDLIVKFEGCYHGHSDSLLGQGSAAAGSRRSASRRRRG